MLRVSNSGLYRGTKLNTEPRTQLKQETQMNQVDGHDIIFSVIFVYNIYWITSLKHHYFMSYIIEASLFYVLHN